MKNTPKSNSLNVNGLRNLNVVNVGNLKNTDEISFEPFSMYKGWVDVYYAGQRIAIINGFTAPLQWTAKNGSNVPNYIIDEIEGIVKRNLR